jgi:hypothetical protein
MGTEAAPALRQRSAARWPAGLACAPAFFGPLAVCVVLGSWVPLPIEMSVLVLLVATVGLLATAPAGLIAVGACLLSLNAFRENGLGVLALHPRVDGPVAVTLLCAWASAWAAGGHSRR